MSFYNKSSEKKRILSEIRRRDEVVNSLCSMASRPTSPRSAQEHEKRLRREIANSNERRRMQSINAGFQYLRSLLPQGDEKLSKASILTQTAEYIFRLEREKTMLIEHNSQLKRLVLSSTGADSDGDSPFAKRMKQDAGDLSDEDIKAPRLASPICDNVEDMHREIQELTYALECEKKIRIHLETRLKHFESFDSSDKKFDVALQDHASYHITETPRKHKNIDRLPKSLVLKSETENFHEVPDSSEHIVPEDLSGRRSSSSLEVSSSNVEPSLHSSPATFTVKFEVSSSTNKTYAHSTSRQNLATIVEAIRHLEGDHMFRDDLPMSPISQSSSEELQTDQTASPQDSDIDHVLTLQHQIIKNAPVSQSRPGVIVSKLS